MSNSKQGVAQYLVVQTAPTLGALAEAVLPAAPKRVARASRVREILTADRRDFATYRLSGRTRFIDVLADDTGRTTGGPN